MYIGMILPFSEFHQPDVTGITWPQLIGLGFLVLIFRRIPAILITYKAMPKVCTNFKEAMFMGCFGPIGAAAVFYLEHARHMFLKLGKGDEGETNPVKAMSPTVYFLVLFSIVVHGFSIPALNAIYRYYGVAPIRQDAVELERKSIRIVTPINAINGDRETFIVYNRFSRSVFPVDLPFVLERNKSDNSISDYVTFENAAGTSPISGYVI